jgi:tripartite-type tricarboxylate transporter receptor subunit TctC
MNPGLSARVRRVAFLLLPAIFITLASPADAASRDPAYPVKPIRVIVAFAAGGAPDTFARLIGQKLSEQMGQPVIVDNRPGATGNIGAEIVAKAAPDGYTLFNATLSLAISPAFYRALPFDPLKSFAPITMLASVPLVLVAHPNLPAHNLRDLITYAKANPAKLHYASVGTGSPQHVSAELIQHVAGVKLVHVPYKSGGAMATAMLGGEAQLGLPAIAPALPHVKAGKLRAMAVTATKRAAALPETPTFAEAGYAAIEADNWNALLAPAGTPKAVIERVHAEVAHAARSADMSEQFARQGAELTLSTPAALAATLSAEVAKWEKVVRAAGIERQ